MRQGEYVPPQLARPRPVAVLPFPYPSSGVYWAPWEAAQGRAHGLVPSVGGTRFARPLTRHYPLADRPTSRRAFEWQEDILSSANTVRCRPSASWADM